MLHRHFEMFILRLRSVLPQQLDEMRRDLRWITDALQYARYKQPRGGVPVTCLVDANAPDSDSGQQKTDSTSSTMDYLPTPSPSPELHRRKAISGESSRRNFIVNNFLQNKRSQHKFLSVRLSARFR